MKLSKVGNNLYVFQPDGNNRFQPEHFNEVLSLAEGKSFLTICAVINPNQRRDFLSWGQDFVDVYGPTEQKNLGISDDFVGFCFGTEVFTSLEVPENCLKLFSYSKLGGIKRIWT